MGEEERASLRGLRRLGGTKRCIGGIVIGASVEEYGKVVVMMKIGDGDV